MRKAKKYFLLIILVELGFFYAPVYAQEPGTYDYRNAGVSNQIRRYLCAPTEVSASQTGVLQLGNDPDQAAFNNVNQGDLYKCINRLYRFAIILASVVGVFFIVIGGYVYMAAEGNQESVEKAKSILISTITALVILFTGYILLKAINPDLIEFHSIQPPSVRIGDLPGARTEQEGSGGGPSSIIGRTGSGGCSFCRDYSTLGLTGNNSQWSGLNTFLNQDLITKLQRAEDLYPSLVITEAYPPTVNHESQCHFNGTCADIGTRVARTAEEIGKLCKALKDAGIPASKILNEYPGLNPPDCPRSVRTPQATGGHLHVSQ